MRQCAYRSEGTTSGESYNAYNAGTEAPAPVRAKERGAGMTPFSISASLRRSSLLAFPSSGTGRFADLTPIAGVRNPPGAPTQVQMPFASRSPLLTHGCPHFAEALVKQQV